MSNQWRDMENLVATRSIEVARAAAIELENRVMQKTPVDKGSLINSWNTSLGAPEHEKRKPGGGAKEAKSQALAITKKLMVGQTLYFNNPQPYAARIEYEGWSQKAPSGMVRINLAHWPDIVAQKAKELAK